MNSYERIKAALSGIMPDRRPVMLHSFMLAAREAGYTMKQYREDPELAAKCHIQFVEKYKVDGILFDVDTALTAGAIGVPVDYPNDEPARTHKVLLKSLEEIDLLKEVNIALDSRMQHSAETIKILKHYFKDEIFVRGNCDQAPFSLACCIRTPGNFMMDLIVDEEQSLKLLEYSTKICRQVVKLMAEAGADMISNGDSPAGPSMISPEMYVKFASPYEQRLAEYSHQLGLPYLLHICGQTDLILDHIATMNLDAIELDYKTSLQAIFRAFKDKITLFGTLDPSSIVTYGTPTEVQAKAKEILDIYMGNPRLVIGAGCAIPPMAPEANIRAIVTAAKEAKLY